MTDIIDKINEALNEGVKTVSAKELQKAYSGIFGEDEAGDKEAIEIHGNWLKGYTENPEKKLAVGKTTWAGKNTVALFKALGIKLPKKKSDMIAALQK
jgi:hypothetical protein